MQGDYELFKLVVGQPNLLRLYQYIDGNPDYTQAEEGISNIYLVNRDPPYKCKELNTGIEGYDEHIFQDHLQTYWLKYFICEYLIKETEQNLPTSFNNILNQFHSPTTGEYTQYEPSIVKLAILNASKVDHGRLLKFSFNLGSGVTVLPSSRLLFMKKEKTFWDFEYLMVVIEDRWLEFPRGIYDLVALDKKKTVHSFLTSLHTSSTEEKEILLKHKLLQVLRFFEILKQALGYEKQRYHTTFKQLKFAGVTTDIMDDFSCHLKTSTLLFFKEILGVDSTKIIDEIYDDFEQEKLSLEANIAIVFKQYHGKPSFRTMENKMKHYYNNRSN